MGTSGRDSKGRVEEAPRAEGAVVGRWEALPVPGPHSRSGAISYRTGVSLVYDIGIDEGGIVYLLANRRLYYWDGEQFAPIVGLATTHASPVERFVSGPDRGLYIVDKAGEAFQAKLYRLGGGEAEHVTDFYCEDARRPPTILVTKSGRLINWGKRFVAAYADGKWSRVESPTALDRPLVFDTGSRVHLYTPGWLCTVDEHGALTTRELDDPLTKTVGMCPSAHGVLWEKNSALLFSSPGQVVWAFDLGTGKAVGVEHVRKMLEGMIVGDAVRMNDGSVWLYVLGGRRSERGWRFLVLGTDGRIVRRVDPAEINWQQSRFAYRPDALLRASDGKIWFAEVRGGIVAYRNGTFTHFGWRDGIRTACNWLAEGPDGTICAGATQIGTDVVYAFKETQHKERPPAWMDFWHEFRFASGTAVPDFAGGVWMCLQERPGMLSRWDGKQWHDTAVPFDTAKVRWLGVDDRGRVIARVLSRKSEAYLVGPEGATGYFSVRHAISAAVEQGARQFRFAGRYPSVVVLDDGRIWYVRDVHEAPSYFDGKNWRTVKLGHDRVWEFRRDDEHDVVLVTTRGKAYAYADHQLTLVGNVEGPPDSTKYVPGSFASRTGGCWRQPAKGHPFHRQLGERMIRCDFSETPFPSRYIPWWIFNDAAGNVWIEGGWQGTPRHMFMKQVSGFELKPASIPAEAAGSATANVHVVLDEKPQTGWRLFYHLNGGEWQGGEPAPQFTIEFPEDGAYEVEVIGLGPLGGTTPESLTFTVESSSE